MYCVLNGLCCWGRFSGGNILVVTVLNGLLNVFLTTVSVLRAKLCRV